ncbi:PhoH-like protein [Bifidobacterium pseudolongum subsp. globosum]|uniref:PhoH-like protein n=1 Tax=Bifidobacterium pseudolongum subsp. globosum TaxID=1690 RepID=A0A2N3QU81_9BIFI|nr:PhoH-like protein [Bifidobacterium pseudolongum subsp. globosum]KFI79805.1 PhoH-like protein [Bifidobacterium pseudolongum subsp. pseudolongum]PKU95593.1 PhoH-like protein [Bifidobacterium pseudolongum subsp. globosum]PKU96576.1 PhoH-like protein [Bifidobacterium pseudolongum subsp. globosum]PKV02967.1 PhoH-like protein [Bifidobacterium pseudolongum subsp. globosum]
MVATTTRTVRIPEQLDTVRVLGPNDEVIRELEHAFTHITMHIRGLDVTIRSTSRAGESEASEAEDMLHTIIDAAYREPMDAVTARRMLDQRVLSNTVRDEAPGHGAATDKVRRARALRRDDARDARGTYRKPHTPGVITYAAGYPVRPKTLGQAGYVQAIDEHTITFGIGPAGTGKTYLAVAKAVRAFQEGQVRRIILTRPAVEAGENLGFLPGSLNEKVDPYLRPLYDALSDMFGPERMRALLDDGTIEVAPLAYMRGRTLNDAYVILDEAQNTTAQQMKMFLTRLGFNTKMVVTGDITQVDLAAPRSGLATIERVLRGIDDIAFVHLGAADVVRHALVGRIVDAYDRYDAARAARAAQRAAGATAQHEGKDGAQ